ncbi:GAF domain-containing SpoIIE family protein phosphatase [Virgisporangium aliadipatigenens]|uniref:GAF domain-containing SpoIIE family protein phosphatase n=1 Tax=Virgisporangium aliadipatigenens TaxID=741659 RepID=UPI001EF1D70D|nr:SpoIIE family protein phosphatase [Virgisporangium aliadipatigenens]
MSPGGPSPRLSAAERLAVLRRSGLGAAADPFFDRFASMVRTVLDVPVALVTLVEADRQVFPGAFGLGEPWSAKRETPLSHSFCQHVVADAAPLVVTDARTDPRVAGNLAVPDLGVVGYAGMPLTDADGLVLGALCAIDHAPRQWTRRELDLLADLAAACSESLRLRIATARAEDGVEAARKAFARSDLLLRASVTLLRTTTHDDVVHAVRDLVTGTLDPAYVGLSLLDGAGQVVLRSGEYLPAPVAQRWSTYAFTERTPSALAARSGEPVLLPDLDAVAARAPETLDTFLELGWRSAASVPLPGAHRPIGSLTFVWKQAYTLDAAEQAVLSALAGYVAQALLRADHLFSREQVAATLQRAMLTELPEVAPFALAARYRPAARGEQVGGDWYDALPLSDGRLALAVGDVAGHDIQAATRMSQLRSVLRGYVVDRRESPSALLDRLDRAGRLLGERQMATAVLAFVRAGPTGYRLRWSNAGHPYPLLVTAGGAVGHLTGRDPLLGVLDGVGRTDHRRVLPPGSTVLLYTDGLLESRHHRYEERERVLVGRLADLARAPLPELLDTLLEEIGGADHEDDITLLALRVPEVGRAAGGAPAGQ